MTMRWAPSRLTVGAFNKLNVRNLGQGSEPFVLQPIVFQSHPDCFCTPLPSASRWRTAFAPRSLPRTDFATDRSRDYVHDLRHIETISGQIITVGADNKLRFPLICSAWTSDAPWNVLMTDSISFPFSSRTSRSSPKSFTAILRFDAGKKLVNSCGDGL